MSDPAVRIIEYWPTKDERCIVAYTRTPETDALTDEELIARHQAYRRRERHLRVVEEPE